MDSKFNVSISITAQANFCKKMKYPHFAPLNGICSECKNNIYTIVYKKSGGEKTYKSGITFWQAANTLITGCPHCHKSYCD